MIIEANGLSVTEAASILGVSRPTLCSLLKHTARLPGEMALQIDNAFGVKMDTLMRMQSSYDIAEIRKRASPIKVQRFRAPAAERPQREVVRA